MTPWNKTNYCSVVKRKKKRKEKVLHTKNYSAKGKISRSSEELFVFLSFLGSPSGSSWWHGSFRLIVFCYYFFNLFFSCWQKRHRYFYLIPSVSPSGWIEPHKVGNLDLPKGEFFSTAKCRMLLECIALWPQEPLGESTAKDACSHERAAKLSPPLLILLLLNPFLAHLSPRHARLIRESSTTQTREKTRRC